MSKNFPNKVKDINSQNQKSQENPNRINKKNMPRHTKVKLLKSKDFKKYIESIQRKLTQGNNFFNFIRNNESRG